MVSTAGEGGARYLTRVQTVYHEGRCNFRVLFGKPIDASRQVTTRGTTRGSVRFMPGARFAVDLWTCNRYGTRQWCCFVCEAIGPDEEGTGVPCVRPAARVLLRTRGAAQSRLFLAWLREVEEAGLDPLDCPAAVFEAAHFRLQGSRADRTLPRRLSGRL
jgi:hypothetical protein